MISISTNLIRWMLADFSNLSAICPAVAENRKNGKIKIPAAIVTKIPGSISEESSKLKMIITIRACLIILSFIAPRNWVMKSGKNLRVFKRWGALTVTPIKLLIFVLSLR